MVFAKILLIISSDTHLFAPNFDEGGISEDFTLKCLGHCLDGEPDTSTIGKGASQLNNTETRFRWSLRGTAVSSYWARFCRRIGGLETPVAELAHAAFTPGPAFSAA